MKRFITCLSILTAVVYINAGCKKQSSPQDDLIINDTTTVNHPPVADPAVATTGMITGKVMPETKFSLLLYNDVNSYEEYSIVNRTGVFLIKNVKAGEYNLVIQPADPAYNSIEISKIRIDTSRTTNLGLIFLP
jgi:hypothetical protein